jgi:peptidoglycan-N-acetylglucosamine deacetylase
MNMHLSLIFDDGPHEIQARPLLEVLAKENVRVNFAHIGKNAVLHPALVRATHDAGHEIVNHSYTHPHFNKLDSKGMRKELHDTQDLIFSITGQTPRWFWPPYGDRESHVVEGVAAAGISLFPIDKFHFISTRDWDVARSGEDIHRAATSDVRDKSVLCFHEWRDQTLLQMPRILRDLKAQGAQFLTFSEITAL